ncbi:MAG: CRISPR-associated protein Cas4, partial [Chloroflexota bacterium]
RLLQDEGEALPVALAAEAKADLWQKLATIRRFETYRLIAVTQEVLAGQPDIGADALAAHVLPVVVEQKIDGRYLGLSAHLSVDACAINEPMVLDLKFGPRQ